MIISISGRIGSGKDLIGKIIQYLSDKHKAGYSHPSTENDLSEYCKNFKQKYCNWEIKKFADKLKEMVCLMIGCTREQLEDREFKEKELGEEWWYYTDTLFYTEDKELIPYIDASLYIKNSTKWYIIKLTPRLLLQLMGTECGRQILHPNIWVNALFADYKCDIKLGFDVMWDSPLIENNIYKDINGNKHVAKYPNWIITDMRFPNEKKVIEDKGGITIRVYRDLHNGNAHIAPIPHESEIALDNAEFDYVIDNNITIEELIEKVKEILIKEKIL